MLQPFKKKAHYFIDVFLLLFKGTLKRFHIKRNNGFLQFSLKVNVIDIIMVWCACIDCFMMSMIFSFSSAIQRRSPQLMCEVRRKGSGEVGCWLVRTKKHVLNRIYYCFLDNMILHPYIKKTLPTAHFTLTTVVFFLVVSPFWLSYKLLLSLWLCLVTCVLYQFSSLCPFWLYTVAICTLIWSL